MARVSSGILAALALSLFTLFAGPACTGKEAKHKAAGNVLLKRKDFAGAEKEYRSAIAAKPKDAGAHMLLAEALMGLGRWDEAKAAMAEAITLKPSSADAHKGMAEIILGKAQPGDSAATQEALTHLDQVLKLRPDDQATLFYSAKLLSIAASRTPEPAKREQLLHDASGRLSAARDKASKNPALAYEFALVSAKRAAALREVGAQNPDAALKSTAVDDEADKAVARLAELKPQSYVVPYCEAAIALIRNRRESALESLEKAAKQPDFDKTVLLNDTNFESLRSEPRFIAVAPAAAPATP